MTTFTPPTDAKHSAICPGEGWISCGWLAFDAWRVAANKSYRDTAEAIGCAAGSLTNWKSGRPVPALHLPRIEVLASVPREAWTYWVKVDGVEETHEPPASEDRPIAVVPMGATLDELRAGVARLNVLLAKSGLSPSHVATLEGKRISALTAISRIEARTTLEDHPDFDGLLDAILSALERTLAARGIDATGARSEFADHLDAIEAERARRAA